MKIRSIEAIGLAYELPRERMYGSTVGIHPRRQVTLIRVRTEDGVEGIGDARAPAGLVRANLELLKAAFIGTNLLDREIVFQRLLNRMYHLGLQGPLIVAYSGLNIALLDALGKTVGLPVCRLIGGMARKRVAVYATGGHLTGRESDLVPQMEGIRAMGVAGAKIKIGLSPESDAARVATARRVLGDAMFLAVDPNANYTADVALDSMRRIAPHRIAWYEEPLKPHDYRGYAHLRSRALMPVATGEAHHMLHDFQRLIEGGCIDIAQPAVCACGGLDEARKIAELCRLNSIRIVPAAWSSGVGLVAALHFAAAIPPYPHSDLEPAAQLLEYDVGENPLRDDILERPLKIREGAIDVPDAPGLGLALNEEAVRRYTVQ
jgi:D-galactarolactone cycloisomerase